MQATKPGMSTSSVAVLEPDAHAGLDEQQQTSATLAVIGGGAAATALLNALIKTVSGQPGSAPHVVVFEPAGVPGPGVAYRTDEESALLNRPVCGMSVDYSDPGHFRRWLARRGEPAATRAHQFAPRATFGRYLAEVFSVCSAELAALGGSVEVVPHTVTDIRRSQGGWSVHADGVEWSAEKAVLCSGSIPPRDVFGLNGADGYVPQSSPLGGSLGSLGSPGSVLVLGSGLTAVDVTLEMARSAAKSHVTMASRTGLVPDVRADSPPTGPLLDRARSLLSKEKVVLRDVLALFDDDLRSKGSSLRESVRPFLAQWPADHTLRTRLQDPVPGSLVQGCVNELTPIYGELWRALSLPCQRRFQHRLRRVWNGLRSPMPPVTAQRLVDLTDQGQLRFAAGLRDVRRTRTGFVARWRNGSDEHYDTVVNATGRGTQVALAPDRSLLSGLLSSGVARPHPAGGVDVDPSTQEATSGLFVVGDLAGGVHFHTSSMESVASQAHRVAAALVDPSRTGART